MIELKTLENLIKSIDYTNIKLEIAWQIELIIKLREKLNHNYKVIPEESLASKDIKKEIDIAIKENNTPFCAIELKMPQNGAYPRRMCQAIQDICFLEQLVKNHQYQKGYFIFLTDNKPFWIGNIKNDCSSKELYRYFRNGQEINGQISVPKFMKKELPDPIRICGHYTIIWKDIPNTNLKYFILEITG